MSLTNIFVYVIILLIVCTIANFYLENHYKESFENQASKEKQASKGDVLLDDVYPLTDAQAITANSITDVWWQRPIFPVGSYAQITNNIRYRKNPDDGECTTIDFCDSLYKNIKNKDNHVYPLKPVPTSQQRVTSTRVNYFTTPYNLFLGPQAVELPVFQ